MIFLLSFPTIDGVFRLSMFSLLYDRGRYNASSERVENLRVKTQAKKASNKIIAHAHCIL